MPIFADVDPETWTIDSEDVRRKITPRTRAIIPVSICGLSPDMDPLVDRKQWLNVFREIDISIRGQRQFRQIERLRLTRLRRTGGLSNPSGMVETVAGCRSSIS